MPVFKRYEKISKVMNSYYSNLYDEFSKVLKEKNEKEKFKEKQKNIETEHNDSKMSKDSSVKGIEIEEKAFKPSIGINISKASCIDNQTSDFISINERNIFSAGNGVNKRIKSIPRNINTAATKTRASRRFQTISSVSRGLKSKGSTTNVSRFPSRRNGNTSNYTRKIFSPTILKRTNINNLFN